MLCRPTSVLVDDVPHSHNGPSGAGDTIRAYTHSDLPGTAADVGGVMMFDVALLPSTGLYPCQWRSYPVFQPRDTHHFLSLPFATSLIFSVHFLLSFVLSSVL